MKKSTEQSKEQLKESISNNLTYAGLLLNALLYLVYYPFSLMLIYNWYLPELFGAPRLGFIPFFVGLMVLNVLRPVSRSYHHEYNEERFKQQIPNHLKVALNQNHQQRRMFQIAFMLGIAYALHFFI